VQQFCSLFAYHRPPPPTRSRLFLDTRFTTSGRHDSGRGSPSRADKTDGHYYLTVTFPAAFSSASIRCGGLVLWIHTVVYEHTYRRADIETLTPPALTAAGVTTTSQHLGGLHPLDGTTACGAFWNGDRHTAYLHLAPTDHHRATTGPCPSLDHLQYHRIARYGHDAAYTPGVERAIPDVPGVSTL